MRPHRVTIRRLTGGTALLAISVALPLGGGICGQQSTSDPQGGMAAISETPDGAPKGPNATVAGALEWAVPLLGHWYAGDVRQGLKPVALQAAPFVGWWLFRTFRSQPDEGDYYEMSPFVHVSILALVAGRIWATVSAIETALRFPRTTTVEDSSPTGGASLELQVTPERQFAMKVVLRP